MWFVSKSTKYGDDGRIPGSLLRGSIGIILFFGNSEGFLDVVIIQEVLFLLVWHALGGTCIRKSSLCSLHIFQLKKVKNYFGQ